jgi:hypothetical protein
MLKVLVEQGTTRKSPGDLVVAESVVSGGDVHITRMFTYQVLQSRYLLLIRNGLDLVLLGASGSSGA